MRSGATTAIVMTRLQKDLALVLLCASAGGLLAYLQRFGDSGAQLAAGLVFGTLSGIAIALLQRRPGRMREIELCELTAPLYGRELARATALVPCVIVTSAVAVYWIVLSLYGHPLVWAIALSALSVNASTLAALSAGLLRSSARVAAIAIACAIPAAAFELSNMPIAIAMGMCVLCGFAALRQYGEALARHDPVRF